MRKRQNPAHETLAQAVAQTPLGGQIPLSLPAPPAPTSHPISPDASGSVLLKLWAVSAPPLPQGEREVGAEKPGVLLGL